MCVCACAIIRKFEAVAFLLFLPEDFFLSAAGFGPTEKRGFPPASPFQNHPEEQREALVNDPERSQGLFPILETCANLKHLASPSPLKLISLLWRLLPTGAAWFWDAAQERSKDGLVPLPLLQSSAAGRPPCPTAGGGGWVWLPHPNFHCAHREIERERVPSQANSSSPTFIPPARRLVLRMEG